MNLYLLDFTHNHMHLDNLYISPIRPKIFTFSKPRSTR